MRQRQGIQCLESTGTFVDFSPERQPACSTRRRLRWTCPQPVTSSSRRTLMPDSTR